LYMGETRVIPLYGLVPRWVKKVRTEQYLEMLQIIGSPEQGGRPTEARQQLSDKNLRTESNIWSQVPKWDRYLDILTD
jgi:hypothetical protein